MNADDDTPSKVRHTPSKRSDFKDRFRLTSEDGTSCPLLLLQKIEMAVRCSKSRTSFDVALEIQRHEANRMISGRPILRGPQH